MTMDKYSQDEDSLVLGLRNEEASLMQKVQEGMMKMDKTASEESEIRRAESRLAEVRAKITEIDLGRAKKGKTPG